MPQVGDIYQLLTCEAKTVNENAPKKEVIEVMLSGSPMAHTVYVVDDTGQLKGIITLGHIMKGIAVQQGLDTGNYDFKSPYKLFQYSPFGLAKDIMGQPVYVTKDTNLQAALEKMVLGHIDELPVLDTDGKVIGDLNAFEILKFI